jgi:hypothetical protein
MADKFDTVHSVKFYECNTTLIVISVVKNLSWNSFYVAIQRDAPSVDKNGEKKQSCLSVYLTFASVPEFFKHLVPTLQYAETLAARDKVARKF